MASVPSWAGLTVGGLAAARRRRGRSLPSESDKTSSLPGRRMGSQAFNCRKLWKLRIATAAVRSKRTDG
jgi:hypothetical protein